MNGTRLQLWMYAVDDELLEEAQQPVRSTAPLRLLASAACLCLILLGLLVWQPWSRDTTTAADLAEYGYSIALPEGAESPQYALIDLSGYDTPMAQATFEKSGTLYTCRALKSAAPADPAVLGAEESSLSWSDGALTLSLGIGSDAASVSWYAPDTQTQWCLRTDADSLDLLTTARDIMVSLGYDVAAVPAGAEDVTYDAFELDGLTVAETTFLLNGTRCAYRIAATYVIETPFADISGTDDAYAVQTSAELGWCPAVLSFTEGGSGKIIWFDVVPGLLYSLTVESGATEQSLLELASTLYTPAQGDVG